MEFSELTSEALKLRAEYDKYEMRTVGRSWTRQDIAQGFVGDVGDLMKLLMAKEGVRTIADVDHKLEHELSDCLWSIIVLAEKYQVDLEVSFRQNMEPIHKAISL